MLALALTLLAAPAQDIDLAVRYPARLEMQTPGLEPRGYPTECDAEDLYELASFRFAFKDLVIETGSAQLAVGHHGTSALWAAVLPDTPGTLAAAREGDGERVRAIYLRFHPTRIAELFPAASIRGAGAAARTQDAWRQFQWKRMDCWQARGEPVVPWKRSLVFDVDTDVARRMYFVDTDNDQVRFDSHGDGRRLPVDPPLEPRRALAEFDQVWRRFDREYAYFTLKPHVDWDALHDRWRPLAAEVETRYGFACVLAGLLEPLGDLHTWVRTPDEWPRMRRRPRLVNGSWQACARLIGVDPAPMGRDLAHARTADGLGYLNIHRLYDQQGGAQLDEALEDLHDTWGLVLDLRFNGGGDELFARDMAGRFLAEEAVYSTNRYRSGAGRDELGPALERRVQPRGPWRYAAPVIVLQGPLTMSSAESFLWMLKQAPNVTTLGAPSAGSSGRPTRIELASGVTVSMSTWADAGPDGTPFEDVGIRPDVPLASSPADFERAEDPVLEAALARLRAQPAGERRAGKR